MEDIQVQKTKEIEEEELPLPLVLEILPGQAGEGLIDIYEAGSYKGKTLKELCDLTLSKTDWSIEEHQIRDDIKRQLDGGVLLCRGRSVSAPAVDYAVVEETQAGEKYFYVAVRALKPQEGGHNQKI